jgi:hypothetical protein
MACVWQLAAALALNVPFGHSHLSRSEQASSAELSCDPQWLSTHETHPDGAPLDAKHWLSDEPLLLLEHANATAADKATAPAIIAALIIVSEPPGRRAPSP